MVILKSVNATSYRELFRLPSVKTVAITPSQRDLGLLTSQNGDFARNCRAFKGAI